MKKALIPYLLCVFCVQAQEKLTVYFDFDAYNLNEAAVKKSIPGLPKETSMKLQSYMVFAIGKAPINTTTH